MLDHTIDKFHYSTNNPRNEKEVLTAYITIAVEEDNMTYVLHNWIDITQLTVNTIILLITIMIAVYDNVQQYYSCKYIYRVLFIITILSKIVIYGYEIGINNYKKDHLNIIVLFLILVFHTMNHFINKIIINKYPYKSKMYKDQTCCAICRDDYKVGDELAVFRCGHDFHYMDNCNGIIELTKIDNLEIVKCPLCQR
ncbi:MAG: hypothetical protein Terrestrivirus1_330 [Terrestrivirus sp.]|uniref:RING-type domain-containing protein n=1 Tax=Terrestrivirus sp. TaxID=2487775 RepID=A0A3G4ZKU5_9VIRU|nr:MAG: hypothetical protein Terrestrivirus1_330 [Terrestrivirus sp.]